MMPIASMGDIAFLLIIFFMVCSNFVTESNIEYKSPNAVDVAPVDGEISVVVDKDGEIYVDGDPVDNPKSLTSTIETMLESAKEKDGANYVLFKCHAELTREQFQPVMEAIVEAGGVVIAVGDPAKDEQE
ncbi:MAG: biopolymer transporter ExbD [Lentisphaeria bacterium]|nr:biopolymer transporter ExbD [Lentisphaeria bacterium]NQZ69821.1 biopolymer transporter ExbD [Lentisphaeria bacterium]